MRQLFRTRKHGSRRSYCNNQCAGAASEILERRALLTTQMIGSSIPAVDVIPGQTFDIPVTYRTLNASGGSESLASDKIDFNLHFDQDQITFEGIFQLLSEDIVVQPTTTTSEDDAAVTGDDNDAATETVLRARYVDTGNDGWPDDLPTNGIAVYVARFTATAGFSGSHVNFSANETGTGFGFAGSGVELQAQNGPVVSLVNEPVVTEGDTANFQLTLTEAQTEVVTVTYTTEDGNGPEGALAIEDYVAQTGQTITFQPGETQKTISIVTLDDSIVETDEFFSVKIQQVNGAQRGNSLADATIQDNDAGAPRIVIQNAATVNEGQDSQFTVTLSTALSEFVTVKYSTADGGGPDGATNGVDFESASEQVLTFDPGETSKTITVRTLADAITESEEEFQVVLSDSVGAAISRLSATGRIIDGSSDLPSLTILDAAAVTEGATAIFTVQLSRASDEQITVDFSTVDGNGPLGAMAGEDFAGRSGVQLVFPAGTTQQTISIATLDDSVEESTETFQVVLSNASNAVIADANATGLILDDDGSGSIGDVDGSGAFDANDAFLMHLVKLSGTDAAIDQFKGASSLSAVAIRANIDSLATVGNVDGVGGFDANDTFLIQFVQLSGTNAAIDQFKGASTLTAAQIRTNVEALAGTSGSSSGSARSAFVRAEVPSMAAASDQSNEAAPEEILAVAVPERSESLVLLAATSTSATGQLQNDASLDDELLTSDDYWSSARDWMDMLILR